MRAVLQRVRTAHVEVDGCITGQIEHGLVVLLGITSTDTEADAEYLGNKVAGLRIFNDDQGRLNKSVVEVGGGLLVVSQFTLYGDCRRGMRPSFDKAAGAEVARRLYDYFVSNVKNRVHRVETGVFQALMSVYLVNDGPVTIICDSAKIHSGE